MNLNLYPNSYPNINTPITTTELKPALSPNIPPVNPMNLTLRLEGYKIVKLKKICKQLKLLYKGNKTNVIEKIIAYLATTEGKRRAYQHLDISLLKEVFADTDPIQTFLHTYQPPDLEVYDTHLTTPNAASLLEKHRPDIRCICRAAVVPYTLNPSDSLFIALFFTLYSLKVFLNLLLSDSYLFLIP